ncbi:hypothetical protein QCB45_07540 [Thiomicrorhabdus sp. ZW0627]|uniref:hypothetical protein n=1 Tax=Thiomicrorhabdus sp. ZW0627 TaxID=3039774 RepID=UPI0024368171|nr:hypothetical protein [Thiomicrorhabdus sp. ZW0627]MDG6774181.1 hypothetical protein [Thiomicrorhabdus sp. ZW0627]
MVGIRLVWLNTLRSTVLFFVGLMMAATTVSAQPEKPEVRIYPSSLMLGERVTLSMSGPTVERDFHKLDMAALRQDFAIYDISGESGLIRLRLYPLTAGKFKIKAQKLGVIHIPETEIEVKPNPHVMVEWKTPREKAYPTQQVNWSAKVMVDNPANLVSFEARKTDGWQSEVTDKPLRETVAGEESKSVLLASNYYLDSSQGGFTSAKKDGWQMYSPAVVVKNTSNRRWFFFDRPFNLEVTPLPSFLPITQAVGKVEFSASNIGYGQQTGDLAYWVWHLRGLGMNQPTLNNVAYQLISQIGHDPKIEWLTESRQGSQKLTDKGLVSEVTVSVPYRILASGLFSLPELQVRYFDPNDHKLHTKTIEPQSGLAVPTWIVWAVQWLGLLLLLLIFFTLLWFGKQLRLNWRLRRAFGKAENARQVCEAMWQWQSQQAWYLGPSKTRESMNTAVQSLAQFTDWYRNRFGDSEELNLLIGKLNVWLYDGVHSRSETEWEDLQQSVTNWSKQLPLFPKISLNQVTALLKAA